MSEQELNFLDKGKQKVEALRVQLHLGRKEVVEKFDEDKKEIASWAKQSRNILSGKSSKVFTAVKTRLEELEVQAALAKAESKDELKNQREKLSDALTNLQNEVGNLRNETSAEAKEITDNLTHKLDDWQTKFDLFKLQMHLGAKDASDKWEERKKELSEMLHEMDTSIDAAKKDGSQNLERFKTEMGQAWKHIKAGFSQS